MSDAKAAFRHQRAIIVDSSVEKKDPALKNLAEGLHDRGLAYGIDGCRIIWLVVEDNHEVNFYRQFNEVEIVFTQAWLEQRKALVRHLSGVDYCGTTIRWAEEFQLKPQDRALVYRVPPEEMVA